MEKELGKRMAFIQIKIMCTLLLLLLFLPANPVYLPPWRPDYPLSIQLVGDEIILEGFRFRNWIFVVLECVSQAASACCYWSPHSSTTSTGLRYGHSISCIDSTYYYYYNYSTYGHKCRLVPYYYRQAWLYISILVAYFRASTARFF